MQSHQLRDIHEGMRVFDSSHREIGRVDMVRFGDDDPSTVQVEARTIQGSDDGRGNTLLDHIAEAFRVDELPEEIRKRLLMQGFVRIDAEGIFAADRYVLPEQIDSISGDELLLNVEKDDLVRRH